MSSQPGSRAFPAQMPSFMSVFGEETNKQHFSSYPNPNAADTQPDIIDRALSSGDISSASPVDPSFAAFHHQPRGSTSTSNSDHSSDSSPTTTISTIDSSSMTDTSPSVSPESPPSNLSPASYNGDSLRLRRAETDNLLQTSQQSLFGMEPQRPTSSGKKPRNLKNLAVNTSQSYSLGKAISTAQLPLGQQPNEEKTERTSAPASPAFIKPPTPPKKRMTNLGLSIKTPPALNTNLPGLTIPPTPSFKRPNTLRHFQSSPSLPLVTPSLPPVGGMQLPPLRTLPQTRGFAEVPMENEEEEDEPNFDVPQSREEKPESYPDGPIRIYESGVDLYFEPTAEVASQYDVVMNVASEVRNPFHHLLLVVSPPQLSSNVGILSKESQEQDKGSPTTPKATPLPVDPPMMAMPQQYVKRPEYIHIPWEHNTDIVPDLHRLVKVIDDRVQQGKRVLVHCQCGVSRSASLIVAYGMYKHPELSVQEAYDAVKKRSKWIGPNMNLIMQLQEFKAGLQRNAQLHNMFAFPRKLSSAISPGLSSINSTPGPNTPRTAPLQPDASPQRASTGNMPMSAGPVGGVASLGFFDPGFRRSWGSGQATFDVSPSVPVPGVPGTPYVDTKGHLIPVVTPTGQQRPHSYIPEAMHNANGRESQYFPAPKAHPSRKSVPNFSRQLPLRAERDDDSFMTNNSINEALMSPRSTNFAMTPIHRPVQESTFNLFSPMATEFPKDFPLPQQARVPPAPASSSYTASDLTSPSSAEFAFTPVSANRPETEDTMGIFSPMASQFPTDPSPHIPLPSPPRQDSFNPAPIIEMGGLTSPRSEEFRMIGFSRLGGEDDNFGIMSPTATEFQDPWAAIQPSIENGDQSFQRDRSQTPHASDYDRGPSTPPALTDTSSPDLGATPSPPPMQLHLDTPQGLPTLKTKFSSPNLAERKRLQQLQAEIEAQLPHHSPNDGSLDEDALMSPRATEFTSNPFHVGLVEEPEVRDKLPVPSTPEKQKSDPRSPAQLGISPIIRNIFDVL